MFIVGKEGVQEKWYSIKTLVADLQCVPRKGFGSASSADSDNMYNIYLSIYTQTADSRFTKRFSRHTLYHYC